jgi:hypothetical protein
MMKQTLCCHDRCDYPGENICDQGGFEMRKLLLCLFLTIYLAMLSLPARAQSKVLSAEQQDEQIIVRIDKKTFTCYRYGDGQKYPYFYPVNGPASGLSLTTESSLPYPHHRSLWFGCDKVNGENFWQEGNDRGQIISKGPTIVKNDKNKIHIKDECEWKQPNKEAIILDKRDIVITAPSEKLRFIDFKITLVALTDIKIEKTNHSLFSARMFPSLSVKQGGTLINAEQKSGEKLTAGVKSSWCNYYGERYGIVEGLAIFDSPQNIWYPSKWFTRDYGFFSPTNMYWLDEVFQIKESESVTFQYRVVVHQGNTEQAEIKKLYSEWK